MTNNADEKELPKCSTPVKSTKSAIAKSGNETITPIEMTAANNQPGNQKTFKKVFMKLGQKFGTVKTTELNNEYLDAVKDADAYKEMLCRLVVSMMEVLQQNPNLVPPAESPMNFQCEENNHPFELLSKTLQELSTYFAENTQSFQITQKLCADLASTDRDFQQKGRRAMHFMRTFINVDYTELNEQRKELMVCLQEMDFAKHSFTNNASDSHKRNYEIALSKFNQQNDKVFKMLDLLSKKKEVHRLELIKFLDEMRRSHEKCHEFCSKAIKQVK